MSGLAAIFQRDGRPADVAAVWVMLAAAPYRGPDGMRVWGAENAALGHAKLAITSEDALDHQPLVSPRSGCVLIADIRLDNRDDLLARLPDPPPSSASDAEIALRAYEAWGLEAIERLLGDFALMLWDRRRQRMLCARDTSGQRSLYYRLDRSALVCASEIQQLLQDPDVPVAPNDERIRTMLVPINMLRNEQDMAQTFYAGIAAVPAGHVLVVDRESDRVRRYWEPRPSDVRYRTDEAYAEHFRALFFEVVRGRLRSTHPVAVLLSGGMDSSSIACTAQQLYRSGRAQDRGFLAYSFTCDGLDCDERPFIEDMQAQYGFEVRYISPGAFDGRLRLDPRGFRAAPNQGLAARETMLEEATRAGVRVLLPGEIADACVYGSRLVFDSLLRRGNLRALGRHLRAYRRTSSESWRRIVGLYCLTPLLPLDIQKRLRAAYLRRNILQVWPYILPGWMPEPLREDLAGRYLRLSLDAERGRRFANDARETDLRLLYPPEAAWHAAPWPVEVWRPYADRRLHEFLLGIPPEQKFEPHPTTDEFYAGSKQIVRRAMCGILPESIRTRTSKTVFGAVWEQEIARQWPEYEAAFGPGARSEVAERGYVDQERFWLRLQALRERTDGNDLMYVMHVVALETWLRGLRQPRPEVVTVAGAETRVAGAGAQ
jgi:asparagine synthase (glutamine-hydrolysing)